MFGPASGDTKLIVRKKSKVNMVSSSKILTVSYGTFSCTLEGFDDSFETMKAIAEYFRDLAADDRYFGAEPVVPDTEVLTRIAESKASQRVESHQEQGRVVLRAKETSEQQGTDALDDISSETNPADIQETQTPSESAAAKLDRLQSAVSRSAETYEEDYSEDEYVEIVEAPASDSEFSTTDTFSKVDTDVTDRDTLSELMNDAATDSSASEAEYSEFGSLDAESGTSKNHSEQLISEEQNTSDQKSSSDDVSRIFEQAEDQRGEPESSIRRNAIHHLRAAVAAARAEKSAGSDLAPDVDEKPYRSDIESVMRPRRPRILGSDASDTADSSQASAPLKLVAEQRVDTAEQDQILPRRISSEMAAATTSSKPISSDQASFYEFVQEMGADDLVDLLEAAAAYMSDVEGMPQFSRPMLMGKLKELKKSNYTREDTLRSFGQLLRRGKIKKLKGGRFSITEETDYRADDRSVG